MNPQQVKKTLINYFKTHKISVTNKSKLFKQQLFDSLSIVQLLVFLEKKYKLNIKPEKISKKSFESVDAIFKNFFE